MSTIRVFDPAMCCSSGVCGPSVDPELTRFAADVAWLQQQGVTIERFNLAQQPAAFAASPPAPGWPAQRIGPRRAASRAGARGRRGAQAARRSEGRRVLRREARLLLTRGHPWPR